MRRAVVLSLVLGIVVAGCGKTGGRDSIEGVYHLVGAEAPTSLEMRGGTFALRRDSCDGIGTSTCGDVGRRSTFSWGLVPLDYWPTPDDFPSANVRTLTAEARDGEIIVTGRSEVFEKSFTQRWVKGRVCTVCTPKGPREMPCAEPVPGCGS